MLFAENRANNFSKNLLILFKKFQIYFETFVLIIRPCDSIYNLCLESLLSDAEKSIRNYENTFYLKMLLWNVFS